MVAHMSRATYARVPGAARRRLPGRVAQVLGQLLLERSLDHPAGDLAQHAVLPEVSRSPAYRRSARRSSRPAAARAARRAARHARLRADPARVDQRLTRIVGHSRHRSSQPGLGQRPVDHLLAQGRAASALLRGGAGGSPGGSPPAPYRSEQARWNGIFFCCVEGMGLHSRLPYTDLVTLPRPGTAPETRSGRAAARRTASPRGRSDTSSWDARTRSPTSTGRPVRQLAQPLEARPTSDTSAALPGSGRTYSDIPSALEACRVRTCRATPCPCAQPLATSAERSYAPATRSGSDRRANGPRQSRTARSRAPPPCHATSPRTPRTSQAPARDGRRSISAGGIPNSSCNAQPEAQPAMSYSGEGEHNRLQISAATASPTDSC